MTQQASNKTSDKVNNKASHRFWATIDPLVKRSLDMGQRAEIEYTLDRLYPVNGGYSDIRFTLGKHFFVFLWGRERRSVKRQSYEATRNPLFALKNLPVFAAIGCTVASICYIALNTTGRQLMAFVN